VGKKTRRDRLNVGRGEIGIKNAEAGGVHGCEVLEGTPSDISHRGVAYTMTKWRRTTPKTGENSGVQFFPKLEQV